MKINPIEHKRIISIKMDAKNYYEYDGLEMDLNSQKVYGLKDGKRYALIGNSTLEYKRERKNKEPKILHTSTSATSDTYLDTNHQLLSYDHLVAIDTNTNYVNGSSVSITAAIHVIPGSRSSNLVHCKYRSLALLELWNVTEKPENFGWWQILQAIQNQPIFLNGKIALVVDSDLGEHLAFNNREKPICMNYYLPENVTIVYASDKGGAAHFSTKMIKFCHDLASHLFKEKNLVMLTKGLHPGIKGLYSHIRQWDTDSNEIRRVIESLINRSAKQ